MFIASLSTLEDLPFEDVALRTDRKRLILLRRPKERRAVSSTALETRLNTPTNKPPKPEWELM